MQSFGTLSSLWEQWNRGKPEAARGQEQASKGSSPLWQGVSKGSSPLLTLVHPDESSNVINLQHNHSHNIMTP